jgi:sugar lactone lactonase YvrE
LIAVSAPDEGIFAVRSSGGTPRRITPESLRCSDPAWSHDGAWLYCASTESGSGQIWKVPVQSRGDPVRVSAGIRVRESSDGHALYVLRDAALWRVRTDTGSEEKLIDARVGSFAVTRNGIYFDQGSGDYTPAIVRYYDLTTRRIDLVRTFAMRKSTGLAVSPDGSTLLVPLNERQGSELMLMSSLE